MKKLLATIFVAASVTNVIAADHMVTLLPNEISQTVVASGANYGSNSGLPAGMVAGHFVQLPSSAPNFQNCPNNRIYIDLSDNLNPNKTVANQKLDYHVVSEGFKNVRAAKNAVKNNQNSILSIYYITSNNICLLKGAGYI